MAVEERELRKAPLLKSTAESETVEYVEGLFEKAKKSRQQFEKAWYMNLSFYFGKQYVQWAPGVAGNFSRLYEPAAPPWRARLVSNKIRPIIRTELAKITKERPTGFVVPATSDDDDLAAAKAAEKIFEHLWRVLNMQKTVRRAEFWTVICGTSFIKDWYDPDLPDQSHVPGSICAEPVSPFHLYVPDAQEEELEHQPYIIHALAKDPEWVNAKFDKNIQPDSNAGGGVLEQRFMSALGLQNAPKSYIAVKEIWIKPNKRYPDGAVVLWANGELLHITESWPYAHKEYPFAKFDHIPTGRFYADSVIPDLIPLQKEYNRTRSQIIEAKNRMSKPQLVAPRGSVDPSKITSEPGLIVFYTPGFQPPAPLPLQSIPSYVIDELDRCQRDMDDISSQHEVTKGRTPPGVTAATAISYLQEEDDSKLAATIASLEEGVEKLGRHFLSHVQEFWDAERQINVVGDDGQFESFMFSKSNVAGATDFKVEAGSATPRSRAAKQAFITELGKMGWISPERALRYLDMAETGRLYEEMQIDSRQAQRENLRMAEGEPVPVNDWDEHLIHLQEHNNYRKRQAFERLDDQTKTIFQQHVELHKQMLGLPPGTPMPPGMANPESQEGMPPGGAPGAPQAPPVGGMEQ